MKAVIIVEGLVQGVGYRFFAVEQAKIFNIKGYVKNLVDGSVEVVAEGDEDKLNDFIEQIKVGPASARVTEVKVEWHDTELGFSDFDIRY